MKSAFLLLPIIASVINGPLAAQWANYPTPRIPRTADGKPNLTAPAPRTADGKPDLSGLWDKISPKYGRNIVADLKPGEVQPWAEALVRQRMEDLGRDSMSHQCLPLGPAYITNGESNGYNDRTWLDGSGHPHTEALRTTERYRRKDFGHLEISMTLQDLGVYAKPWTVTLQAQLAADTELLEYVCNENPKSTLE